MKVVSNSRWNAGAWARVGFQHVDLCLEGEPPLEDVRDAREMGGRRGKGPHNIFPTPLETLFKTDITGKSY